MAIFTAVGLGGVAAVAIPTVLAGHDDVLGGVLAGEVIHIPIGHGFELHWSSLVFAVVSLVTWGSLLASRQK